MKRVEFQYKFKNKRNYKLITPCCNKRNKDGKFANYSGIPDQYGYCHSCGKSNLPPTIYINKNGVYCIWDNGLERFTPLNSYDELSKIKLQIRSNQQKQKKITQNYITESVIWENYHIKPENNLLKYLRNRYGNEKTKEAKEMYVIGTSKRGGTIFWNINKSLKTQKSEIQFFDNRGKRTPVVYSPYTNAKGYFSCLFGEHLLIDELRNSKNQIVVLVEGAKTAIVGSILLPKYTWLAYGGANGLTDKKINCLIGYTVLIIPDMSNNAVQIINSKIPYLREIGIDAKLWDMTNGKSDAELKLEGVYNDDLEDVFRLINF
ncbi:DUF6371 domain-containing protein [Psychroserpens burtonensis]|uniref:DUF6371 domain-containing protein n=1 Tax=Psychroserpens burtonensis TaxID=49278 RepID=UPI0003F55469|nr:DUF6371 domain-containing protein [Psychroserpens burtonensis]